MKLVPLFDKIVLKHIKPKENVDLILPESISESPSLGEVVCVGIGGKVDGNEIEIVLKEKDKVLFHKYVANEFTYQGETLYIIKQGDILCILEDKDE